MKMGEKKHGKMMDKPAPNKPNPKKPADDMKDMKH
jgi:hypothetical protein